MTDLKWSDRASLTGNRIHASNRCVSGLTGFWGEGVDCVFIHMYHVFGAVIASILKKKKKQKQTCSHVSQKCGRHFEVML